MCALCTRPLTPPRRHSPPFRNRRMIQAPRVELLPAISALYMKIGERDRQKERLITTHVHKNSLASELGIVPGAHLLSVNKKEVSTIEDLVELSKFLIGGRIFSRAVQDYLAGGASTSRSTHLFQKSIGIITPALRNGNGPPKKYRLFQRATLVTKKFIQLNAYSKREPRTTSCNI